MEKQKEEEEKELNVNGLILRIAYLESLTKHLALTEEHLQKVIRDREDHIIHLKKELHRSRQESYLQIDPRRRYTF